MSESDRIMQEQATEDLQTWELISNLQKSYAQIIQSWSNYSNTVRVCPYCGRIIQKEW